MIKAVTPTNLVSDSTYIDEIQSLKLEIQSLKKENGDLQRFKIEYNKIKMELNELTRLKHDIHNTKNENLTNNVIFHIIRENYYSKRNRHVF